MNSDRIIEILVRVKSAFYSDITIKEIDTVINYIKGITTLYNSTEQHIASAENALIEKDEELAKLKMHFKNAEDFISFLKRQVEKQSEIIANLRKENNDLKEKNYEQKKCIELGNKIEEQYRSTLSIHVDECKKLKGILKGIIENYKTSINNASKYVEALEKEINN